MVWIIWSWAWQHGPTRDMSAKNIVLPYSLHPPSGASVFLTFFVCFKRCITNTLDFQIKLEDCAPLFRVPLSIIDVRHLPEEALKLPANFLSLSIPRELLRFFFRLIHQWYWRSPLLSLGYYYPLYRLTGLFGIYLSQKIPCFLRPPKFSEGLLCACEQCTGKSSP